MRVEWTDKLSIGIGIIDDQHKKLVERVNAFVDAVECRDTRKIEETVNYLIGYTIQHFGAEELIMLRNGYSEFKRHREEHNWFINAIYDVNKELLDQGLSDERLSQVEEMLAGWIVNHIQVVDKRLAEVIR
ncbi:bacteriohemerythrin [Heliobacterium gestii]|uniref:Bacteriohemerythrin n=1 Tax=Heliomicrobium gestii TaxID=2699 RepID=A0A845L6A7_HELGE|nr:bacteriohemerythrin [Heliomicrobium gestii]MBM7865486.1 hemerythrin [Heliomicrobium gestii]MZP41738.1 bacteriohemerythrin [Heliomicrobium gestii]